MTARELAPSTDEQETRAFWRSDLVAGTTDLVLTLHAAAVSQMGNIGIYPHSIPSLKTAVRKIDDEARVAAEVYLTRYATTSLELATVEGAADGARTPPLGQRFGPAGAGPSLRVALDYVDGTRLVAIGSPGAIALGAIGPEFRSLPDLEAASLLIPQGMEASKYLDEPIEDRAGDLVEDLADRLGKAPGGLAILTHSMGSRKAHQALTDALRSVGVGDVLVPNVTTIESPYVIAATHLHRLDAWIGVYGLPEIAINVVLCRNLNRGKKIEFRPASTDAYQKGMKDNLAGLYAFTDQERTQLHAAGLDQDRTYGYRDVVGNEKAVAALVAITDERIVGVRGIRGTADELASEAIVSLPGGQLLHCELIADRRSVAELGL